MFTSVAQANAAVIEQIRRARPHWLDVQPASSLISELNEGKTLLHAGPPMRWQEMTGPMKGACVGACLFEGWAKDEAQALAILEQGEVNFIPCHHVNAVGPMGGITSASMPMLVVENVTDGNRAYCNLNEGIGKVMRFGAYGEDVLTRHRWMRDDPRRQHRHGNDPQRQYVRDSGKRAGRTLVYCACKHSARSVFHRLLAGAGEPGYGR